MKSEGLSNYQYNLLGSGNPDRLSKLAKELGIEKHVVFQGEYSHDAVMNWFEDIDIYIHPSRSEGLPRTIIEAMSKAVPCICSSVGGIPELINKECLFSYNGNEINTLVNIIKSFSVEKLQREAIDNFNHSNDYEAKRLEKKRNEFFTQAINEFR